MFGRSFPPHSRDVTCQDSACTLWDAALFPLLATPAASALAALALARHETPAARAQEWLSMADIIVRKNIAATVVLQQAASKSA